MYSKFFLQSKTIIGALLIALSMIAPVLGIEFTAAEADTLLQKIGLLIDSSLEIVGLILVVWGRVTAVQPVSLFPPGSDKLQSPWFVSLFAVLALAACQVATPPDATPAERLRISYDSTKPLIDVYLALPECAPEVVGLCWKPDIAEKLSLASTTVEGYLTAIEETADLSEAEQQKALRDAQNALRTLITLYAVQALTKA